MAEEKHLVRCLGSSEASSIRRRRRETSTVGLPEPEEPESPVIRDRP